MAVFIQGYRIDQIAVVDDDPSCRDAYKQIIDDIDATPILENGPLDAVNVYVPVLKSRVQAVLCDYHLKVHGGYASYNGDELAASLYQAKTPVVLCTRYTDWKVTQMRCYRRFIPRVLSYDEAFEPDNLIRAFELCIREFKDDFAVTRRRNRSRKSGH